MVNKQLGRLWPSYCVLCGNGAAGPIDLCDGCAGELPWLDGSCHSCGVPLFSGEANLCGQCLQRPPPFSHCCSALRYETPAAELIAMFKFNGELSKGNVLAELLAHRIRSDSATAGVEFIVPMPLHWTRRWQRGFNQSEVIADVLHRRLGTPVAAQLLRRARRTGAQHRLGAAERVRNLRAAFCASPAAAGHHLALVDDVVTTTATAAAATQALLAAGAASVQLWSIARTPR